MAEMMGFEADKRINKKYGNITCYALIGDRSFRFRSKLEHKVAMYLEVIKNGGWIKDWDYEGTTFRFPDDKWLIDFEVRNNDDSFEYIEAKGMFDARSRRKLKLVHKYRPDAKITMVFQNKRDMQKARLSAKYCYRFCLLSELTRGII